MFKIVVFLWCVAFCVCEPPSWNSAIPRGEYGAPPLPTTSSVEISKENVAFVEQTVEINTPRNQYYAPPQYQFREPNAPSTVSNAFDYIIITHFLRGHF